MDLLFPRTDAGVALQAALVALAAGGGLWWGRRRPNLRLFVIGAAVTLVGLMAVRALH